MSEFAAAKTTHPWEMPGGDRGFAGLRLTRLSMPWQEEVSNFAGWGLCAIPPQFP